MRAYQFARPPRTLLRRGFRSDNLALVPGSVLPFKAQWQAIANSLPSGSALIILPATDSPLRKILETVAAILEAEGHQVTTMPEQQFTQR